MQNILMLAALSNFTWYVFPLAFVISLVYSTSRYELPERIVRRAIRLFTTIVGFMAIVFAGLILLSFNL